MCQHAARADFAFSVKLEEGEGRGEIKERRREGEGAKEHKSKLKGREGINTPPSTHELNIIDGDVVSPKPPGFCSKWPVSSTSDPVPRCRFRDSSVANKKEFVWGIVSYCGVRLCCMCCL